MKLPGTGTPAVDGSYHYYFGIGMWGVISMVGNQLTMTGKVDITKESTFQFQNPEKRYKKYIERALKARKVAEAFGI